MSEQKKRVKQSVVLKRIFLYRVEYKYKLWDRYAQFPGFINETEKTTVLAHDAAEANKIVKEFKYNCERINSKTKDFEFINTTRICDRPVDYFNKEDLDTHYSSILAYNRNNWDEQDFADRGEECTLVYDSLYSWDWANFKRELR